MTFRRFTLIASGATQAARKGAFPLDEPLDAKALAEAKAAAGEIGDADRIWCSPALAARQTAEALDLKAEIDRRLGNPDFGRWAGKGAEAVMAAEPAIVAGWLGDSTSAPHGGESLVDLVRRIGGWLDEQGRHAARHIVVCHATCICAAVVHVLAAPPEAFWRIDIPSLSFTSLTEQEGQWRLRASGCRFSNAAIGDGES